jgi:hypothetical protein
MRDEAKRRFMEAQKRISDRRKRLESADAEVLDQVKNEALERLRKSSTDKGRH